MVDNIVNVGKVHSLGLSITWHGGSAEKTLTLRSAFGRFSTIGIIKAIDTAIEGIGSRIHYRDDDISIDLSGVNNVSEVIGDIFQILCKGGHFPLVAGAGYNEGVGVTSNTPWGLRLIGDAVDHCSLNSDRDNPVAIAYQRRKEAQEGDGYHARIAVSQNNILSATI